MSPATLLSASVVSIQVVHGHAQSVDAGLGRDYVAPVHVDRSHPAAAAAHNLQNPYKTCKILTAFFKLFLSTHTKHTKSLLPHAKSLLHF